MWLRRLLSISMELLMVKGILSKRDTVLLLRSVERIRANPLRGSNQGKSRRILVRDPSTNYQWVVSLCVPPNRLQVCAEVNYSCYWRSCPKCFKKRTCRSYSGYHYSVDLLLPFSMAVRSESSWSSKWTRIRCTHRSCVTKWEDSHFPVMKYRSLNGTVQCIDNRQVQVL